MNIFGISNVAWIVILALVFVIGGMLIFILGLCASAAKGDADILRAFTEMQKAENETWKYDYSETTTSGCPVENSK
jgi:hypothetical protein